MPENIFEKIPNKIDHSIYCIHTEYKKDHTKPYTTILGCKVANLDTIPNGKIGKIVELRNYTKRVVKGNILEGIIFNEWIKI